MQYKGEKPVKVGKPTAKTKAAQPVKRTYAKSVGGGSRYSKRGKR